MVEPCWARLANSSPLGIGDLSAKRVRMTVWEMSGRVNSTPSRAALAAVAVTPGIIW
ncbi:hypothetical protein D3C86_2071030 [compost metagenome]